MARPSETDEALDALRALEVPRYGGFWRRVAAAVVDTIWLTPIIVVLLWWFFGPAALGDADPQSRDPSTLLVSYGVPAVAVLGLWGWKGATPGKMLLGMRIVDARTLGKPSFGTLALRYAGYYVSIIPLGLGLLWVAVDRRKQGWHDKIAGTLVLRDDEL